MSKLPLHLALDLLAREVQTSMPGRRRAKRVNYDVVNDQAELYWETK
jgi:hypothetical protein